MREVYISFHFHQQQSIPINQHGVFLFDLPFLLEICKAKAKAKAAGWSYIANANTT
jgi:hypothetical protein